MKKVFKKCVVQTVGRFPRPGLGHDLQEVDGTLRVSDEQVKKVLCKEKDEK